MGKCCICGKEADFLHLGMWWCEEHRELVSKDAERKTGRFSVLRSGTNTRSTPSAPSIDLGLKWV